MASVNMKVWLLCLTKHGCFCHFIVYLLCATRHELSK